MKKYKAGFSFIEVLIFTVLVSFLFVGTAYGMTVYLTYAKQNENKILATHYSEELLEWLRGERERGWTEFVSTRSSSAGLTWCFPEDLQNWPATSGACGASDYALDNRYKREAVITTNDAENTRVQLKVTVKWLEAGNVQTVEINSNMALLE